MSSWAIHDAEGRVLGLVQADETPDVGDRLASELDAQVEAWPEAPFIGAELRVANRALHWHDPRSLGDAKAQRVAAMREARDEAINAGFAWDGSVFDSDAASQTRLMGLRIAAGEAGFITETWRLADNSWRTLSAVDALAVWAALKAHVKAAFVRFAEREAAIQAATTVADVENVAW